MLRFLILAVLMALPIAANAQSQRIPTCGAATPPPGISAPYMDANGNTCVSSSSTAAYSGNGSLATSTSSANVNTMTVNANGAALPSTLSRLIAFNVGATDAAICVGGGTCTCPANGVATTNGLTLKAGGGYNLALSNVASSTPTIVACSGTPTVQFQW